MQGFWSFEWTVVRIAAAAVLLALTTVISLSQYRRGGRRRLEAWVEVIRWGAVLLLAITLLRPEYVRLVRDADQPALAVLLDQSGSMATRDLRTGGETDVVSRAEWLQSIRDPAAWQPLSARYRLRVSEFDRPPTNDMEAARSGTDINRVLDLVAREGSAVRAVLLLSDGDWNQGESPVVAATRLRSSDVPVYAITVGRDRYLPDLELSGVRAPAYSLVDEQITIPFTLQSRLADSVRAEVVLLDDGAEVARRTVEVPAMAQVQQSISLIPTSEGERMFTIRVEPVVGETRADNNEKMFRMALRREVLKLLIVETEPRWEYRYLRNAAVRDPGVQVDTLLLHPGVKNGGGFRYISSFPASRDALSKYDVIFLGDVGIDPGGLTEEQAGWLADVVKSQASGLVFLPGSEGRQASLMKSALGELMPVELEPQFPKGHGFSIEGHLTLSSRGREHLLTSLAPTPEQNERIWASLPGFCWYAGVLRARPGSEVLAVHSNARNEYGRIPIMVTRTAGNGKVLFMGMDSAWRWRRGVEDLYHYRYWIQVFRWMAHQRHLAYSEGIRFFYSPETPAQGDRLFVHATALDARGFPLQQGTLEAAMISPSGREERLLLAPEDGTWGAFLGRMELREGGEHRLTVTCRETGKSATSKILAQIPRVEQVGRPARPEVMRELAHLTQGRAGGVEDLPSILSELKALPQRHPREVRFRLWCHPAWLAVVAGFFAAYWVGRKGLGRI